MEKHHYQGLTDQQVLESRKKNGVNILTPPEKETWRDILKDEFKSPFIITMLILMVGSIVAAGILTSSMGNMIWAMPAVVCVAALLLLVIGFFGGFEDPLFKILITAFILSMGISIYEYEWAGSAFTTFFEPIGIIVALMLATGVAFFLERKNEKTFQSLNDVNDDTLVKVIRNGNICQVPRKDIVVGDIVILETGEEVPADCELLESLNLSVNESSLTGEPMAHKSVNPDEFAGKTYPSNKIMKGTIVLEGYCTAKVLFVGDKTECGKVFEAAQVNEGDPTPLSEKLKSLADWITKASYVLAVLIVVGRLITYFFGGHGDFSNSAGWIAFISYFLNTIMIAVTLIVVAVPEGLPMSVTLSLAFSMKKLMNEKTLPRTMHSCETMGATSVICTDKTGTLTQNQMKVAQTAFINLDNQELGDDMFSNIIKECIASNTTADLDFSNASKIKTIGNPTEGALLLWMNSNGVNYLNIREDVEIIERVPFSTELKYMATVVKSNVSGLKTLYVKGAPEIILQMTTTSESEKESIKKQLLEYQSKAMRTLGFAYKTLMNDEDVFFEGALKINDLNYIGIVGIADPIREDVPGAIRECIDAGINVKIVTGDTLETAKEIGRQVGLYNNTDSEDSVMAGNEFAKRTDKELLEKVDNLKILWRARPNDKERLVKLLKQKDHVVAVTGDGTNDAPALNAADVGLSMGDGTAVAKEASDMTILDNSLKTISNAVMWGRSLYENIQRFLLFQLTVNVSACLIVLLGAFLGMKSPLTVTQMLWVNLIMDTFAAIALASLPPTKSVMKEKPRNRKESILDKSMKRNIFGIGGFFFLIQVVLLIIFESADITMMRDFENIGWGEGRDLSEYESTMFFTVFVMTHFWYLFNARSYKTGKSAFHLKGCKGFIVIAAVIFLGQVAMIYVPGFNEMFNCVPLKPSDFMMIVALTSLVLVIPSLVILFKKMFSKPVGGIKSSCMSLFS